MKMTERSRKAVLDAGGTRPSLQSACPFRKRLDTALEPGWNQRLTRSSLQSSTPDHPGQGARRSDVVGFSHPAGGDSSEHTLAFASDIRTCSQGFDPAKPVVPGADSPDIPDRWPNALFGLHTVGQDDSRGHRISARGLSDKAKRVCRTWRRHVPYLLFTASSKITAASFRLSWRLAMATAHTPQVILRMKKGRCSRIGQHHSEGSG